MTPTHEYEYKFLVVDSSAWLRRYLADRHHGFVTEAMDLAGHWVASQWALTELTVAMHHRRTVPGPVEVDQLVRRDWDHVWEVPVDTIALHQAADIAAHYRLDLGRSIHLASAQRLPVPVSFLTLDSAQIQPAFDLGYEVVSPHN